MKLHRLVALLLIFACIFSLCGCDKPPEENNAQIDVAPAPQDNDGIIDVGQEVMPYTEQQLYQQLFDPANKIEISLDMPEAELAKLQQDYDTYRERGSKSPIYRKAVVLITITNSESTTTYRIAETGVRMKGNTSRTDFYSEEEGIYNNIHLRLDFQETFEDENYYGSSRNTWQSEELRQQRKDRTFATLEKLELRWNKNYDATYLREAYAYDLYRSEGILAPYTNLSTFTWNSQRMGVYLLVEPIDKVFIENHLPEQDWGGDLYKCGWTFMGATFTNRNSIGIENEDNGEFYVYDLKTNKKTSEHASLNNLITVLNSSYLDKDEFANIVDMDYFLNYAAVSYFLGNPDDLRNNYNNCYIYFRQSNGKMIVIPYDYDRCLGVTVDYNPSGHAMTRENPFSERCEGMKDGPQEQQNPLFVYSVDKGGFFVKEFAETLEQVAANEMFKPETFEKRFNTAKALYGDDVNPERKLHNSEGRDFSFDNTRTDSASGGSNMSFRDYVNTKMNAYRGYMRDVDSYIDYVRPAPVNFYIRGDFNDWSNRDEYGMETVDGMMVYTLSFNHDFAFKVFDNVNQAWYGTDFFPEEVDLEYDTNKHANVILRPGTYQVVFDPVELILYVTKQ